MKKIALLCLFSTVLWIGIPGRADAQPSVLIVIPAAEFNDLTYETNLKAFSNQGYKVYTVSMKMNRCRGLAGLEIRPDFGFDSCEMTDYKAVILVGGPGSASFWDNPAVSELLKTADKNGKVIAAEGLAVLAVANAGLLYEKRCTAISTIKRELRMKKAVYTGEKATKEGRIVTCDGPLSAGKMARLVLTCIKSKE